MSGIFNFEMILLKGDRVVSLTDPQGRKYASFSGTNWWLSDSIQYGSPLTRETYDCFYMKLIG